MNVNELADKLLVASNDMEHNFHVSDWKLLFECALVMRNQQAKLECYERLADASEMASNPMGVKSRVALRNPRVMTKEEEIRKAVEAEREACANALAYIESFPTLTHGVLVTLPDAVNAIRARSKHD